MPLYGAGAGDDASSVLSFLGGQVVLVTDEQGNTRVYADDGQGGAPVLTSADCGDLGAALTDLSD